MKIKKNPPIGWFFCFLVFFGMCFLGQVQLIHFGAFWDRYKITIFVFFGTGIKYKHNSIKRTYNKP